MNFVQVTSLQIEALRLSTGKKKQEKAVTEQAGPQAAWLPGHPLASGHFMSLPCGDSVPALLTRRGSGTVIYAVGSCPVSFR